MAFHLNANAIDCEHSALIQGFQERKIGSLLGLAWGDAFGVPVEFWSPAEIQSYMGGMKVLPNRYPMHALPVERLERVRPLGIYSDDTQQGIALLLSTRGALTWGEAETEEWVRIILQGFKANGLDEVIPWRGYGSKFREAAERLAAGAKVQQSGSPSAGVGAAMRSGVLGAYFATRPETLKSAVMESSLVTHADLRAAALAYAVAWAVGASVRGDQPQEIIQTLPSQVRKVEEEWKQGRLDWNISRHDPHAVSSALEHIFKSDVFGRKDLNGVATTVLEFAQQRSEQQLQGVNDPFALAAGVFAVAWALGSDHSPGQILSDLVNFGGDTDTAAAIAGTLLGARFGSGWIPLARLKESAQLQKIAEGFFIETRPQYAPRYILSRGEFFSLEMALSRQERNFQREAQQIIEARGESTNSTPQ